MKLNTDFKAISALIFINKEVFLSRRVDVVIQLVTIAFNVIFVGIFANLINLNASIEEYGTLTYLQYLMIGSIIHILIFIPKGNISSFILSRLFPFLYNSPPSFISLLIGINLWQFLWNILIITIITILYILFFGLIITINIGAVIIIIFGFILIFAIDLFSTGFRLITKASQDPLNWFLGVSAQLVSGLYFPPEKLPEWLQFLSKLHPETYILKMGRLTMGGGYSLTQILPEFINLVIMTSIILCIGIVMFIWGFRKSRVLGTIGYF